MAGKRCPVRRNRHSSQASCHTPPSSPLRELGQKVLSSKAGPKYSPGPIKKITPSLLELVNQTPAGHLRSKHGRALARHTARSWAPPRTSRPRRPWRPWAERVLSPSDRRPCQSLQGREASRPAPPKSWPRQGCKGTTNMLWPGARQPCLIDGLPTICVEDIRGDLKAQRGSGGVSNSRTLLLPS